MEGCEHHGEAGLGVAVCRRGGSPAAGRSSCGRCWSPAAGLGSSGKPSIVRPGDPVGVSSPLLAMAGCTRRW